MPGSCARAGRRLVKAVDPPGRSVGGGTCPAGADPLCSDRGLWWERRRLCGRIGRGSR